MSWEEDWEKYAEEDSSSSEDEAVKQLRREAELERNKPKKKSLAQRKAEEEAARLAEQAKIDAEVRSACDERAAETIGFVNCCFWCWSSAVMPSIPLRFEPLSSLSPPARLHRFVNFVASSRKFVQNSVQTRPLHRLTRRCKRPQRWRMSETCLQPPLVLRYVSAAVLAAVLAAASWAVLCSVAIVCFLCLDLFFSLFA